MRASFIKLHLSVLLAGFTGVFGRLIGMHQLPMAFWRTFLAAVMLLAVLAVGRRLRRLPVADAAKMCGVGVLLALHWAFFFGSIKASNVSVGVVCYSLVGVYSALLEPLLCRSRVSVRDLLLSLVTIGGIALIFNFDTQFRYGIALGVVSSLFASLFTITNKMVLARTGCRPALMLCHELCGGAAVLGAIALAAHWHNPAIELRPSLTDFLWLLILASACTICLQILQIQVLKKLTAFTVNLTYNLEPIYSILIAIILFGEAREMTPGFIAGLSLIMLSVALQTLSVIRERR